MALSSLKGMIQSKKKVSSVEAKRILAKVPPEQGFWLCTAQDIRSLGELSTSLLTIDDDAFRYHVNRTKNDFEMWIRTTIQDRELSREISRVKTKETLHRKVSERVALLSSALKHMQRAEQRKQKSKRKVKSVKKPAKKSVRKPAGKRVRITAGGKVKRKSSASPSSTPKNSRSKSKKGRTASPATKSTSRKRATKTSSRKRTVTAGSARKQSRKRGFFRKAIALTRSVKQKIKKK